MAKICKPQAYCILICLPTPAVSCCLWAMNLGPHNEWNYKSELQWDLLQYASHAGVQHCVQKLNELYKTYPALI